MDTSNPTESKTGTAPPDAAGKLGQVELSDRGGSVGPSDDAMPARELGAERMSTLRRGVYWLLVVVAVATQVGRLGQVQSASGRTPFLSANDRSRWATVRALVDHGTYELDEVIFRAPRSDAERAEPFRRRISDWYSIDLVRHHGRDGRWHFYSSKPPLLATLLTVPCWVVQKATGTTLAAQPLYVGRILLVLTHILPLAAAWLVLARVVETWGTTDWGRVFVMGAATFGTLLSSMVVSLNNHIPAAICAMVTIAAVLKIWRPDPAGLRWYVCAGFAAALTATNELPALSLTAIAAAAVVLRSPKRALLGFAPAALLVAVAAIGTNYAAHGSWRPPYAHRSTGALIATVDDARPDAWHPGAVPSDLRQQLADSDRAVSEQARLARTRFGGWAVVDSSSDQQFAVVVTGTGGVELREWDDWYDYPNSYWTPENLKGVDRGEPSRLTYAFHALIGHHGIISLTPVWLLSLAGCAMWLTRGDRVQRGFAASLALVTLVCLAFFLARPLIDRNYGGVSCGFRWLFWLIPAWLIVALPAADWLARNRWGRTVGLALLAIGVFSAQWSGANPWSHPWLYQYWLQLGWIAG